MKEKILEYFYNNHDNRSMVIAKHFNLTALEVDKIIDEELSKKTNYYFTFKEECEQPIKKGTKLRVIDEDGLIINDFDTMKDAAIAFGLSPTSISNALNGFQTKTVKHYSINRTLKHVKL